MLRDASSLSFRGAATFDTEGLQSAAICAYASKGTTVTQADGAVTKASAASATELQFGLTNSTGFSLERSAAAGQLTLGGSIASLKLLRKEANTLDGVRSAFEQSYQYTNTSASADDIDLTILQKAMYSADWNDREALRREQLKGNDIIRVSARPDGEPTTVDAGAGNDRVTGSTQADHISGEEGDDKLSGGPGTICCSAVTAMTC